MHFAKGNVFSKKISLGERASLSLEGQALAGRKGKNKNVFEK